MRALLPLLLVPLVACATATLDVTLDLDGDGLLGDEELALGLDPDKADTDGDGFDDDVELALHTDPADALDHPYAGGWPIGACHDDWEATGFEIGEVPEPFALIDQHDETVHLEDFCDRTVLLETASFWCAACVAQAPRLQALYEKHSDTFIVITLLVEDANHNPIDADGLDDWVDSFGLTHPVVHDANYTYSSNFFDNPSRIGLPSMNLLAPGGEILEKDDQLSTDEIEAHL